MEKIKGSSNHDGGRIAFGPDGYLYITTGDAETPNLAQDKNSLNGKILRIKDDGGIPEDNPFGNAVYSLGHRNPQGLAWDKNGTLWETEHGPSGIQTGNDEVNIIIKGGNYGWPTIKGDQTKKGLISPIIQSGTKDTWAPSGMAYYDGSLFFSGLRGEALYEAKIRNGNKLDLLTHFKQEFGRIRAVVLGPDGYLYLSTSNQDGRGRVREGDDKIIKINPKIFR
ncbi:MAG: Quinoprotein glucose dehydrogenase [Candidatus Collierbacteria bacterium GW2011_GWD2_42_50]|nr:MAG: Quinoprotein glucose dehydrogenase [Candidatus Collierbacteria bacterium GW2011_GWD2_42_50]